MITNLSFAQKPVYNADVPKSITTPDKVKTDYLGDLDFVDGFPTDETVEKTYDFLDVARAAEVSCEVEERVERADRASDQAGQMPEHCPPTPRLSLSRGGLVSAQRQC